MGTQGASCPHARRGCIGAPRVACGGGRGSPARHRAITPPSRTTTARRASAVETLDPHVRGRGLGQLEGPAVRGRAVLRLALDPDVPGVAGGLGTHLTIDLVDGRGGGFSLETPDGKRFLTRSRMLEDRVPVEVPGTGPR